MTTLTDTAAETARRFDLLPDTAPALVMVSGGGDSVALLHLLALGALGERPLRVLHVNHLLRGVDSHADEAFVRDLCSRLGIECRVVRYDVSAYAESEGLNLEDAGRRVRYRFAEEELDALCTDAGSRPADGRIAVAHTRDDRVETFFMRAISGSGLGALGSIAPARGRIVRPLIDCDRADVRAWLVERGETWREDATNSDTARTRAYVRAELVPAAERLNPSLRASLARTMDLLAGDDELLSGMARSFALSFCEFQDGERVTFERAPMLTLDRAMARRTVRTALLMAFPDASRIEADHVEALVDGMSEERFARDLPSGLRAVSEYDSMVVSWRGAETPGVAPCLLTSPGIADLGPVGTITASVTDPADTSGAADSVVIDAGLLGGELTIDSARPGDRMRPLGMEGTRKLSDLLIDAKVPKRLRRSVPVVRDGERIVWLAGVRMSDEYRVSPVTRSALRLTWERSDAAG